MISKVQKRDGRIVKFDLDKIAKAINKAFIATGSGSFQEAREMSDQVLKILEERGYDIPGVETIQDIVEEVLIRNGYADAAKAYILYRQKRSEIRRAKSFFGVEDELKLSLNAIQVLKKRYLLKDEEGNVIETPLQLFRRVARAMASVDENPIETEEAFFSMLTNLEFMPNTPALMNAGTPLGQLSACFVLPVGDSLIEIFDSIKHMAIIQQSGGGTGFSFSRLRPAGDIVRSTKGVASGPVSFMQVFDAATEVIKQGGKRRGANMGILRVDHPDIIRFITAKIQEGILSNFNISVAITDDFMRALENGEEYELINPRNREAVRKLAARDIWNLIINTAWRTGDPGVIFIDEINRRNPTPAIGNIESTNPCGELPLLPYESCNLGSINLSKMVKDGAIDYEKLENIVNVAVRFLDNTIDANKFPLPEIETITKANRKIGLGVMGFADMLLQLGIPYDSREALAVGEEIMKFISEKSHAESRRLAEERGEFPNWAQSIFKDHKMRNATTTTVAPTGTISIIAGCSSGIEPLFAISFVRNVLEGTRLVEVNPIFEKVAIERNFYSEDLMIKIAREGSIRNIESIPDDIKRVFVTAFDISPEWHVRMQAAFQKYSDNAVSKTINFPENAGIKDIEQAYMLAYRLKCKGITIYRYGSKKEQVLYIGDVRERYIAASPEFAGGCITPNCEG